MSEIKAFLETSFLDWPGRVCAVMFLGGCNFRCPFCHNHSLVLAPEKLDTIDFSYVLNRLAQFKKWLGGVCVSGGEPTLSAQLPAMLRELKREGWPIKLDTNGSQPHILAELLAEGLLDMVSMDVKAPLDNEKYNRCAGTTVDLDSVKKSISLLKASDVGLEFRMTILPRFHTEKDIIGWAEVLRGGESGARARLKLQNFNPRSTMDPHLKDAESFAPQTFEELQRLVA